MKAIIFTLHQQAEPKASRGTLAWASRNASSATGSIKAALLRIGELTMVNMQDTTCVHPGQQLDGPEFG